MAKGKQTFEELTHADLSAFRRSEWFETSKLGIQILLMVALAIGLVVFLVLVILAGVTQGYLPDTKGVQALSSLFIEIASNAKAVAIFALGFFFREYLNSRNLKAS